MTTDNTTHGQLSTQAFWSQPASKRAETFARLRSEAPVSFQPPPDFGTPPSTRGFWAVTTADLVTHVSRTPETFCSGQGVNMEELPVEFLEAGASFLVMDAPRHTAIRGIVSRAFTPRRIAELDEAINARAGEIVREFVAAGGGDAVVDFARELPLWTISTMMGIPGEMQDAMYDAAETMTRYVDPSLLPEGQNGAALAMEAATTLHGMATQLAAERRSSPGDDLISALAQSDVEGGLDDQMIGSIFLLFAVAGNDTTRNSTSHGLKLLADHPDQWRAVKADPDRLINPMVEEIVRYATPVIQFRRTATRDVELGGQRIAEGDMVVIFYESANKDESVFENAATFDVTRDPNPHVGFGGGGPHFCLGANLARAQLRDLFRHLVEADVDIEAGEPTYLASHFIHGIVDMPVSV